LSTGAKLSCINSKRAYSVSMENWRSIDYKGDFKRELEKLEQNFREK